MKNNLEKKNYPYNGIVGRDVIDMKKAIKKSQQDNSLPDFGLRRIELHPTSLCQYKCPFCYGTNFKLKQKIDIPLDVVENNILKDIKKSKFSKDNPIIILAGLYSEPLCHNNTKELIKLLGKYKFRFGIYTNGGFLNNDISKIICESAKQNKSNLKSYISFNVIGAIINKDYEALENKIRCFIEIRNNTKSPMQVNVPILVDGSLSGAELKSLQKKLFKIGVDKIRYSLPQIPVSDNKINRISTKNIKIIEDLGKKNKNNIFVRSISGKQFDRCYVLANTVSIDHEGLVYPCSQTCSSSFKGLDYGSVKKKKLSEIWDSHEHHNIYQNFSKIPTYCRCNLSDQQFNTVCSFLEN